MTLVSQVRAPSGMWRFIQSKSLVSPAPAVTMKYSSSSRPGHGQVGFDAAPFVEKLSVDHLARWHGYVVGADALEHLLRIRPLHKEHGHGGEIVDPHLVSHGQVLLGGVFKPVLACPGIIVFGFHTLGGEPVGPFPPGHHPEAGPLPG